MMHDVRELKDKFRRISEMNQAMGETIVNHLERVVPELMGVSQDNMDQIRQRLRIIQKDTRRHQTVVKTILQGYGA